MTTQEFFENLKAVRSEFKWNMEPDSGWVSDGRATHRGWVRGRPRKGPAAGAILEPIGAVCYALTGKAYGERGWAAAGRELGLAPDRATELNAAANSCTWDGEFGMRKPVDRLKLLRRNLLQSLDLGLPRKQASPDKH